MLSRVVYRKQRGRKIATTLAAVGLLVGTIVLNGTALAVHDEGVFQLDGNAVTAGEPNAQDNPGSFSPAAPHDWSQVYADRAYAGTPPFPTSGAVAQSFITDITGAGDNILTGGSTKDIYDLPSWLFKKTGVTSVQDKDDIEHAFAAQYSVDKSGGQCGSAGPQANCVLLYFGADRFANSGSTTMGFWFYKSRVQPLGPDAAGNGTFTGSHVARSATGHGDILIVSDFLIGGAAPTVSVFEWVNSGGSASTHLDLIGGGTATLASCTSAPPTKKNGPSVPPVSANDNLCATTNQKVLTSPWGFTAKTGETGQQVSEFMEGGINMTALGLGNECFNSFLAETRSSPSPTSTLSDFALGNFGSCGATAVTTPSADTGDNAVSPGTGVTDHFVVTGTSSGGTPPYPTSDTTKGGHNVFFSFCGPMLVTDTTGTCNGTDPVNDPGHTPGASFDNEALANTATQGVSDATSSAINTAAHPLAPGRYCFSGTWAGDNNYTDGAGDASTRECFVVRTIPTGIVTTPSASSTGTPAITTTQPLGTLLYDKAVVTATASGGGDINGSVTFFICNPAAVLANGGDCHTGGTQVGATAVSLTPIVHNPPQSTAVSTPGVAANVAGTWCFRGEYTVTGTTYTAGDADGSTGECVQVGPEDTNTVTTPRTTGTVTQFTTGPVNSSVTDHAVVTAVDSADGTPTGTITFYVCDPTQTTGAAGAEVCATGGTLLNAPTAAAVSGSNPPASSADSTAVIANMVGTWCFRAVYTPGGANGGNYNGSSDARHSECFVITDSTGATSAQTWLPNDSATITSVGGTALSGTLSFTLYDSDNCTGTVLYQEDTDPVTAGVQPYSFTNAASPVVRSTNNSTVSVTTSKTVSWLVTFTSSNSLVSGSSHCEKTALTITN